MAHELLWHRVARKSGYLYITDEQAVRLKTMLQVGRIASLTFLAAVDDVPRFDSSRKLVSYSGLCPTVRSNGERTE
ncbi:MAG: transposase [Phycisphaerae bacterium]